MSTAARIDELLSKFDENPRRYFAPLANEYRKAGDLTQAIALCREHLPKQPGHMSGHIVYGQALYEHGDLVEAQTVFEAALALDPENLIALRHLGDIARARGDASSARRWYGRVLEADPRNDDIAALLATLPSRATPISAAAIAYDAAPPAAYPNVADTSFVDEPAWHTPAILESDAVPVVEALAARPEPELLDLEVPVEPAPELPTFFAAFAPTVDQADAAFGTEALPELVAEPTSSSSVDADAEALLEAVLPDAAPLSMLDPVAELPFDGGFAPTALDAEPADAMLFAASGAQDETRDVLSDALGAFASHDPIETVGALELSADVSESEPVIEAASSERPHDALEYGDGLEAITWPDASQFAVRSPSPAASFAPVDEWMSNEPAPDASALPTGDDVSVEAEFGEVESLIEAPIEIEAAAFAEVESLIETPHAVEAEVLAEVESLIDAPVAFEAEVLAEVESLIEPPLAVEAEVESLEVESLVEAAIDEDPPFSAGDMPWMLSTEDDREADALDTLDESALPESPAFVTETMAELFVAQGFVPRAIAVYEELVARRPDEPSLALRLAELRATLEPEPTSVEADASTVVEPTPLVTPVFSEPAYTPATSYTPAGSYTPTASYTPATSFTPALSATPIAPVPAFTPARSATPRGVPFVAAAPRQTAREWLSLLAAMQVIRRTPVSGPLSVSMPTPADGLASLFGASPLPADDVAARSLATAFGGAVPLDSSTPLFDSGDYALPQEPAPVHEIGASADTSQGQPSVYSFDRFFPDPAMTASGPTASSDVPPAAVPPGQTSIEPTSPGADLAQFSHWLKGLSNS